MKTCAVIAVLTLAFASGASAQPATAELRKLTLEELMRIEVTSVTRQPEPAGTAAAAISVITRDDIRRSGVTTIADALALADGVHVARFNNGSWSISARGFNGSTPNKLLVMVDGRNEFTPLFTGVFWNMLDYVLEDIDRIEVIRGPASTLWGANAVNGVVNIITRHSRDTRGTFLAAGSGNEDPALLEARYGGGSDAASYRVYGKFAQRDAQHFSTGGSAEDTRRRGQAGFRLDRSAAGRSWFIKGDVFHSLDEFIDRRDGEWTEIGLQARLNRELSSRSGVQLQSYYRREYRNIERQLTHHLDTFDVDFQQTYRAGTRQNAIWGGAFRMNRDKTYGSPVVSFDPASRSYPVFSAFVQDEVALRPDSLFVTGGVKLEHNAFSGADWQPSVRARWLTRHHVLWGAVARAVRRPTRFDDDLIVGAPNGLVLVRGSDDFESEVMTGWEIGYRSRVFRAVTFESTVFVQDYDQLRSQEAPPAGVVPVTLGNTLNGRSAGVELAGNIQPMKRWRLHAGYTYLDTTITRDSASRDVSMGVNEANDPHHLFTLRSAVDLASNVEIDVWLRSVAELPNPHVPAYSELNARLGWRATRTLELALIGQDLLHAQHPEFGTAQPRRIEFERSVRALLSVRR